MERVPPADRLCILAADDSTRALSSLSGRWRVEEEELPVRLLFAGRASLELLQGPGTLRAAVPASFRTEYHWNPFADRKDKVEEWRGRICYGVIAATFSVDGDDVPLEVEVVPSGVAESQILLMKASLANISDELVINAQGRARSEVGIGGGSPMSPRHVHAQLDRFVEPLLPTLRRVGLRPRTTLSIRSPQRAGVHAPPGRERPSIDTYENRFIAQAIRSWSESLLMCAAGARHAARAAQELGERVLPAGVDPNAPGLGIRHKKWREEADSLRRRAEEADALRRQLGASVPWATELPIEHRVELTPAMSRDPRYYAVFVAWWAIRRECVAITPLREASLTDSVASFLYEKWACVTLAAMLIRLGWDAVDLDWLERDGIGAYDTAMRSGVPWAFTRGAWTLQLAYDREFHKAGPLPSATTSTFEFALGWEPLWSRKGYYCAVGFKTPDYSIELVCADGRRALLVGDCIYNPILDGDQPMFGEGEVVWPTKEAESRFVGKFRLGSKLAKVRTDYAGACFAIDPEVGATRAVEHLGFVIFPGPEDCEGWVAQASPGVVPLPLLPSQEPGGSGIEADSLALAHLEALIAAGMRAARPPTPRSVPEPA